jgi:hypothetical protein
MLNARLSTTGNSAALETSRLHFTTGRAIATVSLGERGIVSEQPLGLLPR